MSEPNTQEHDAARWQEDDSAFFARYGDVITPSRAEQHAMINALIPAERNEPFRVVDLACGAGGLIGAILDHFPLARGIAYDGSDHMLVVAADNLSRFENRIEFRKFDLFDRSWLANLDEPVRAFVSSLAIHHLDGESKQQLFRDLYEHLEPGGALLIVDLMRPVNARAYDAYAENWEAAVEEQFRALPDGDWLYQIFRDRWSFYRDPPDNDPTDKPSKLTEQLGWLREAGYVEVDCFWLRAGHAIYGGYRPTER
ncbi:MAG TPA: methyltransferase domain-containing protein [Thermomicrobiaceae bacterium]|nr:methyltransferase domain-containing protein [Thermomicrobiaceae bacterium]